MNDREMDLLVAELQDEIKQLRGQRDEAVVLVTSLLAVLKDGPEAAGGNPQSHGDKASY
jgi:hypothetical protein